ncbi:MAG: arginine deiminase-related protein [Bacteroidota bacterium]
MQTTSHILMIRPVNFSFNTETAVNNAFQVPGNNAGAQEKAVKEFDQFVSSLRINGVDVTVINDTPDPYTPDSIFPNNWVSFHQDGKVIFYPMYAPNRRLERKQHVIDTISNSFIIEQRIDLSKFESENIFLEGTGSMVLDREYKIAYACLSPRTDKKVLDAFCSQTGYSAIVFTATDSNGKEIYHTNVMMCIADKYAVICLDSIADKTEREKVIASLTKTHKAIIDISFEQMNHFAGNMLQVENKDGEKLLVMSSQAFHSLNKEQVKTLSGYNKIIHSPLTTIETNGGGSARCMMAEIHLPKI